ncbi:MAG: rod shape-determining protein MreB [Thiobacillus sp.]|nr:rod shape-determining protein MreB [Thiobacillus sp.]
MNLFRNTYYVRIQPDRLTLTHVESGREVADSPVVALSESAGKAKASAVGVEAMQLAGRPDIRLVNGFRHPRTLLADFTAAEMALKHLMARLAPGRWFAPAPVLVLHPLPDQEGGLTAIEVRAFRELALGAGARQVYLWQGDELALDQLRELDFSRARGRLLDA